MYEEREVTETTPNQRLPSNKMQRAQCSYRATTFVWPLWILPVFACKHFNTAQNPVPRYGPTSMGYDRRIHGEESFSSTLSRAIILTFKLMAGSSGAVLRLKTVR